MHLAWRLALRDLRGGLRGMRVVLACLALGVAAIAAVGSLRAAVDRGLATDGARLLGGDISIESGADPLPDTLRHWIAARGGRISAVVLLRTLAVAASGDRVLVELKAVDQAYPLLGAPVLDPPLPLVRMLAGRGVVADPLVLQRLGLHPGDTIRLGNAGFTLRAALVREPDRAGGFSVLGPRVMIAAADLPATGLIQPGSLLTHDWRVVLPPGTGTAPFIAALRQAFPDTGWRVRDAAQAAAGLDQAVRQTSLFLVLVGLSALLVGGIGVATGVRAWLEGRARTIAILRCIGASARLVAGVFALQVGLLCAAGIAIGVVVGAALPVLGLALFGDLLPLPAETGLYPVPLLLAALYGLLTAASFALWPLGRAARISGAALFRDAVLPSGGASRRVLAANLALGGVLAVLIVATAADRRFALWFCAGALLTLATYRGGAWLLMRAATALPAARPAWLRLGLANLHRPGSATPLLLAALGLGLTTLATVALIEGNIRGQFEGAVPKTAPSFFFIDIQNDQLDRFRALVADTPGTSALHVVPSLRARIVALRGVPVDRATVAPGAKWALRGDRGLTYSAGVPDGSRVTEGKWWPADYAGPPLVSLDDGLARGWGLHVGDTLRANVLGRDIDFRVANLRAIDWRALTINFTLVAAPGLLEHAPQMHIATLRDPPAQDAGLLRRVTDALPNVTGIRVADVLASIAELVGRLGAAMAAAGGVTLVSGALVLAGAVAAGQRRRIADAVVLRTLGATSGQIRAAWMVEFGAIGAAAGLIACVLGTLASWAVTRFLLQAPWQYPARNAGADGRRLRGAHAGFRLCRDGGGAARAAGQFVAQPVNDHSVRLPMRLFRIALVLACVFTGAAGAGEPGAAEPPLRAGVLEDAPPYVMKDAHGALTGFTIELFRLVAARMQRQIAFSTAPQHVLFEDLEKGKYDTLPGPIAATPEHAGAMLLLEGYSWSEFQFGVRRGDHLTALPELRGKRLAVRIASVYAEWANRNAQRYGFTVLPVPSSASAAQAVIDNQADASLSGSTVQGYAAAQNTNYVTALPLPETRTHQSAAVRRSDPELREEMEDALRCLKMDGTVARLSKQWFGRDPEAEDLENLVVPGYGVPGLAGYDPKPPKTRCQ